ncbi:class I SAM-dependent methyltransferase [Algihabitans albus]|uniref:class I SAM-dependent methyltransferase n=1 Tax=Algihabitans albus TaxID=2164067 RepID=UPI000E5C6BA3|nr:class I SAM-dependent methyltransferase [Algihabitans albus]
MDREPDIGAVRAYWESRPLGSLEVAAEPGTPAFFEYFNRIREQDEGLFARSIYEFDRHAGQRVLDIGCGNGWLVENFARGAARTTGIDLTRAAVKLTRSRLQLSELSATLLVGNAERLPFDDESFDFVTSSGVLHHTPNTEQAMAEAVRVIRRGSGGMIALYYRHFLLKPSIWPITRFFVRLLFAAVPGRNDFGKVASPEDLVRLYDGNENPIGRAYDRRAFLNMLPGCRVDRVELHFFPTRFLFRSPPPMWVRRLLDRWLGLLIYVRFTKL